MKLSSQFVPSGIGWVVFWLLWIAGLLTVNANPTTTGSLVVDSTFECLSVTARFSGDTSANNSTVIQWRRAGDSIWQTAFTPYIDRRTSVLGQANPHVNQARVSIVGLQPGTSYEVRAIWSDADGVSGTNPLVVTASTPSLTPPTGGRDLWVNASAPSGGTGSSASPFNTLSAAVSAATAGDVIKIQPGTYPAVTVGKSGTAAAWIKFEAQGATGSVIIGGSANSFTIDGSYLWFRGITLPVSTTHGFVINAASHVYIDSCNFSNISSGNEYGNAGVSISAAASRVWVRKCSFRTANVSTGSDGHGQLFAIYFRAGSTDGGHVVSDCSIIGPFRDGIGGEGNSQGDGPAYNSDICRNVISGTQDDGIECEGANRLVRIWGNTITNHTGQSIFGAAGSNLGPLYVFRNVLYSTNGVCAVKQGNNSPGPAYFFHNTIVTSGAGVADGFSDIGGSAYSELHTYRNNIVQTARYGIYRGGRSNQYDYNLWNPANWMVDEWNGTGSYQTLTQFRTATGQEAHGLQGSPTFTSGTLTIAGTSPAVDKGVVLPNFNDASSAWPFAGSAPDIGAFETGAAMRPAAPSGLVISSP